MDAVVLRTSSSTEEPDDLLKRLCLLIFKCGHTALRNYVDRKLSAQSTSLSKCLANEKTTFDRVKSYWIITPEQYDVLYSSSGTVSTSSLNLRLIMCLIRYLECFKLNRTFYWNILPGKGETSIEADICRLMHHMNKLFQVRSNYHDLTTMWEEIERILLRINTVYPMAGFKQTIADIRYRPLKEIVPEYESQCEAQGCYEPDRFRGGPVPVPSVSGGDIIGSSLKHFGTIGPFVRLLESGEKCFLTAGFVFPGSEINGLKVYAGRYTDICGEVITNGEEVKKETDAALQKIVDDDLFPGSQMNADFFQKDAALVKIYEDVISEYLICKDTDDLSRAGLQIPYKMRGTCDLRKLNPETYMKRKIVVRCDLSLIIGNLNSERSFVLDAESPISPYAIAGSAVFLVEDIHTLSCIGIVIGTVAEKTYFFTSIQDNLEKLSHSLGQSVVIQPFDNTTLPIKYGTLSEDSEDSEDISSFQDDVIRSKDSQKDGILNNCEITKLLLNKGRKSQEVFKECQKICKVIKDESEHITHVEAAYRFGDDKHVIFLVFAAENIEIDLIWETEIRIINTFSDESSVVLHCKENSPLTEIESQRIGEIIDMHSKKLMSDHKFLSAISASSVSSRYFGPITIKHLIEKRPCIVFNVLVKGIIPLNEECFPTELDGMPVDVREGGVRLCVNKADEYQENATLGCKITSSTCPGKSGTLGGFIEHPEYGLCGITCAHVVANDDDKFKLKEMSTVTVKEDHIMYQPGDDDKSKNKLGKLVQLTYKEGENGKPGVDLALFRIEKRAPKEGQFPDGNLPSFNTGLVWGKTGIPSGQRNVQKFGYVTLNTSGVMQFDNCAIKEEPFFSKMTIGGDRLSLTTTLFKQYQIKSCDKNIPFCKQGDSGALVFMEDNTGEETTLRCIGMLVGLTDDNSGYVTPITAILDELKVKQLKPFTTHSTNSTILEQISGMLNTHFDRFNERFRQLEERISRIEADNKK